MIKAAAAVAWLVVSTLFPTPLHLVRRIDDPISKTTTVLDEFCYGDKIVSVSGKRVAITDYATQTLIEIDHAAVTYSLTRFDEIARARPLVKTGDGESMNVVVDRSVTLSRDAVEAIVGAAYPNRLDSRHEKILAAAAPIATGRIATESIPAYGLPTDTSIFFEDGLAYRNVIVKIDHDIPPASVMLIDPGATRVESRLTRAARELQQLDKPPKR